MQRKYIYIFSARTMTEPPATHSNNGLFKTLIILTCFFLIAGIVVLFFWLKYWQYEEATDDAYVSGNRINIISQIEGRALSYFVDNTNYVVQGQLLVHLDPKDYEIAYQDSLAKLAQTVRQVRELIERTEEQKAIVEQKRLECARLTLDYIRRKELVKTGAVSDEEYTNTLSAMDEALASKRAAKAELLALKALSDTKDVASHPLVISAIQAVKQTYLNLGRCVIYAPASGFVAQRSVQVGQWITPQTTLLSIIPLSETWVDANFKETQLTNVRIGQPVSLISDIYGSNQTFHGKVVGIGAGTGSVFSILPPQNATGNWIKIVQRVPVKISLNPSEIHRLPLSLGLSMTATIDTHDLSGARVAEQPSSKIIAETTIYKNELEGIDERIYKTLSENGAL